MKNNPFIYLRGLKHVSFSVFCVEDGQKYYYDPQFGVKVPYSSGQQVKYTTLEKLNDILGVQPSPTTFYFDVDKNGALKEGEVLSICNPEYVDQLFGGWMRTPKGGTEKTVTRRSPLCISAMKPLHSLLASIVKENISFDRSSRPDVHKAIVRDANGNELTDEQIDELLNGNNRSLYRKWIPDNTRATGLFVHDIAIDMRRLFCVSMNKKEAEVTTEMADKLKSDGWKPINTVFGEYLLMPKEQREKIIPALADALIEWHITSNQSRTFDLMETLAITITDNANTLASSIRAKLINNDEDYTRPKAIPIVDDDVDGANTYITLAGAGYVVTDNEDKDALKKAKKDLIDRMLAFVYENQM